MQESRIDDYWNIDGSRDCEKPPDGYTWSGEGLTKRQATSRPDHSWPELWRGIGKKCPAEGVAEMVT